MNKLIKKRLGSALIIFAVVTAFLTGIVGYSASQIFGSSINALTSFSVDSVADNYAMSQINQFRNAELGSINDCNRQAVAGSDKLYQTISHKDENGMRYITLQIFYDNETTPRSQFTMRKSLSGVNPDARPIYQTAGSNIDGSMSQKAVTDTYLQKKDAVTRVTGQAVGSSNQGVYMNSKVVAGDNVFRLNQNNGSNNIGVITEVGDGKGGTLKYIDYVDKSQVMSDIQLSDSSNTSNGYIKFGKDLVFAWKKAGMEEKNKYYTITKPYAFKTLYSGIFDANEADEPSTMTGVWANMRTTDTADVYYMDSPTSEIVNFFWFGYSGEKELPAIPVPMRTLTVGNTEHQQIVVRVEDIYGTYYTLTNGQSGRFPEGSSFTVSVNADTHYVAGKPNVDSGLIYGDTNISVSNAVFEKHDFSVPVTEHQNVTVTVMDAQTGEVITIQSGETKKVSYSSQWISIIESTDSNYYAGSVIPSSGVVTGDTVIQVAAAIAKPPDVWNWSQNTAHGVTIQPRLAVYDVVEIPEDGYYNLNLRLYAGYTHNHSSSNEGNSYFRFIFREGDVDIFDTGWNNGFYGPIYGKCNDYLSGGGPFYWSDFGTYKVYFTKGLHKIDCFVGNYEIRNKHSGEIINKIDVTATYLEP